jgi:hypothetical protein
MLFEGAKVMAQDALAKTFQKFCAAFSKSSLHVRLLAYAIGAVVAHEYGMFAVLGVDLYGQYLRKSDF